MYISVHALVGRISNTAKLFTVQFICKSCKKTEEFFRDFVFDFLNIKT